MTVRNTTLASCVEHSQRAFIKVYMHIAELTQNERCNIYCTMENYMEYHEMNNIQPC